MATKNSKNPTTASTAEAIVAVQTPKTPKVALATITVLAAQNPKRPGTLAHRTFELYRSGMTTHEFVALGGFGAALTWDAKHGFIALN